MKVWIYVEGPADVYGLNALWESWTENMRPHGHGIKVIPFYGKDKFFLKIGSHAAQKLVQDVGALVVGLPDFYPNRPYVGKAFEHPDLALLKQVQQKLVKEALQETQGKGEKEADICLSRFYPTALKHDLEMLLLAAVEELRAYLGTDEKLENRWRKPVEDQNQNHPPKHIVEELFRTKKGCKYKDTSHAPAVLRKVTNMRQIIFEENGQVKCPVFQEMLDWIAARVGVSAY